LCCKFIGLMFFAEVINLSKVVSGSRTFFKPVCLNC
jgi:hypothetical protein